MASQTPGEGTFQRKLRLFDATAIVAGSMIGSGIFIVSSDIARNVGAPGWHMLVWLITGILTIIAALTYGELASLMPHAGGQYVFLKEAYNPLVGFLFGWSSFLVIQCGTIAAVAMGFAKFTGVVMPWVSETHVWFEWHFLKFSTVHVIAIGSVAILTFLNTRGIVLGKFIQNLFTSTKVAILLAFIVIGLLIARNTDAVEINKQLMWSGEKVNNGLFTPLAGFGLIIAMTTAMVGSLFSSDAWNNITFASDEVVNPKRNLPLSLIFGTIIVTIVYLLTNAAYLSSLPLRGLPDGVTTIERGIQFASEDRIATAAMEGILGGNAAVIMAIMVMISTFGCNNGLILSGARVYYAMAMDGLFFKKTSKLNRYGVPGGALLVQGIWASLLCLSGTYSNLLDYVIFTVLLFYILTIISVFILRKKYPEKERAYKAPAYPVLPSIYILAILFIMTVLLIYKPLYTWPGLIIIVIGIPVYFIWQKTNQSSRITK